MYCSVACLLLLVCVVCFVVVRFNGLGVRVCVCVLLCRVLASFCFVMLCCVGCVVAYVLVGVCGICVNVVVRCVCGFVVLLSSFVFDVLCVG